jgi:hypothetical protein
MTFSSVPHISHQVAWLLGDAVFEQGASSAYNCYATAAVIARQYVDEARYQKSVGTSLLDVTELAELDQLEQARFLAEYVSQYWRFLTPPRPLFILVFFSTSCTMCHIVHSATDSLSVSAYFGDPDLYADARVVCSGGLR